MAETNLIVARHLNGSRTKGTTQDFHPDRPSFHVQTKGGAGQTVTVRMADLKAVFFVKDLLGNPGHVKPRTFEALDASLMQGKRLAVLFKDGELLLGYTLSYTAGRQGFWIVPADPTGNNIRAYVLTAGAKTIKVGPAADELVRDIEKIAPRLKKTA